MANAPTFIGIDPGAVKQQTKVNQKSLAGSTFDDKLYATTSELSAYMGPALSSAVSQSEGSSTASAMAVDAAINGAATGQSTLSTGLTSSSGLAAYSTGGGYSGLSTGLTGSSAYAFDPYGSTTTTVSTDLDTQEFASNMTSTNTEFLTMQAYIQNESSKFTMLSSILKSQHDSQMTAARNAA